MREVPRETYLIGFVEHNTREFSDLRCAERRAERLALHAVLLALCNEHARAKHLR
jgi:hypothetical protein